MKPLCKYLKPIALFLAVTFLVQSCVTIYHAKSATIDEALYQSKKPRHKTFKNIKVKSSTKEVYKFKSLIKEEDKIYGIAHKNWKASELLSNQIVQYQDDKVKILLTEEQINEIYLKNNTFSTIASVGTIIIVASVVGVLVFAWTWGGPDFASLRYSN